MPRIFPAASPAKSAISSVTASPNTTQLLQQCRRVLQHCQSVVLSRQRWIYLLLLLAACVVFANLAQDKFVMVTQASAELCMILFVVYYVASLSFILSFAST